MPAVFGVPDVGSKVTSLPASSTALHWVVDAQATLVVWVVLNNDFLPAALTAPVAGLKVTSLLPKSSTAVHWDADGHATDCSRPESIDLTPAPLTAPLEGLNVSSFPLESTAVHCVFDGHDTDTSSPSSSATGAVVPGEVGLKVISWPVASTAVHCDADGHEMLQIASWPAE